jgi:hypothetical protein
LIDGLPVKANTTFLTHGDMLTGMQDAGPRIAKELSRHCRCRARPLGASQRMKLHDTARVERAVLVQVVHARMDALEAADSLLERDVSPTPPDWRSPAS